MTCEEKTCWDGIDRADALGPFCSNEALAEVLETYPAAGDPDYNYFLGLLRGKAGYRPPEGMSKEDHLAILDFMAGRTDDPSRAAEAAGYRDGILIASGFFD